MKKHLSLLLASAMGLALLAGCGSASSTSTADTASTGNTASTAESSGGADLSDKTIVCIMKDNVTPFHISVAEGCESAGTDYNVKVTVQAPTSGAGGSNEEQTQLVEQAIASQVDAVVIVPVDTEGIIPAIKKLNEAGIPVIDCNTKIGGDEEADMYESFVAIENYTVGYNMATELCNALGGKGTIFLIEGPQGAQTSIDRTAGAKAAIAEFPDITIVADQSADYNRATAMNVVQNLLQATPDVDAILCCNDEMALGAAEAVDAAGRTGEVKISGVDGNADTLTAIKNGSIYCTCNSNPHDQGYYAVYEAVKLLSGEEADEFYPIDTILINADNVDEFMS